MNVNRTATALVALVVVIGTLAALPGAGLAAVQEDNRTDTPTPGDGVERAEDNASIVPGERLSAVVGVQEAEFNGTLSDRAFGLAVANASSDERVADIVAETYEETRGDVDRIERRMEALNESHSNGSIGEGKYKAEIAVLAVQAQNAERMANATENASEGLPAELLEERGVNVSNIQRLKEDASDLSGPEVAEVARSIAGKETGTSVADEHRDDRNADRGNNETAAEQNRSDGDANQTDADTQDSSSADGQNRSDGDANRTDADTEGQSGPDGAGDTDDANRTSTDGTDGNEADGTNY